MPELICGLLEQTVSRQVRSPGPFSSRLVHVLISRVDHIRDVLVFERYTTSRSRMLDVH